MSARSPIEIHWRDLEDAFDWSSPDMHAYLDRETGEVLQWSESEGEEVHEERCERIDAEPERYAKIEPPESGEVARWMEAFAETVTDPGLRRALDVALAGKGAFGRFKYALGASARERERWFEFRQARLREQIDAWLEAHEIEAATPPPWQGG